MILPDVNVILYAFNRSSPWHEKCLSWLEDVLDGPESVGASWGILQATVRIASSPSFGAPIGLVLSFVDALIQAPSIQIIEPGTHHWVLMKRLIHETGASGATISDLAIAALALEHDCTLVTFDRFFRQVPDLRCTVFE